MNFIDNPEFWKFLQLAVTNYKMETIVILAILLGGYIIYKILRHYGKLLTPVEQNISRQSVLLEELSFIFENSSVTLMGLIEKISTDINSKLTSEQVDIVLRIFFEWVKFDIMSNLADIHGDYHNNVKNKKSSIDSIREEISRIIIEMDRQLEKIPNTTAARTPKDKMISSLDDENFYKIVEEYIDDKNIREFIEQVKKKLAVIVSKKWMIR